MCFKTDLKKHNQHRAFQGAHSGRKQIWLPRQQSLPVSINEAFLPVLLSEVTERKEVYIFGFLANIRWAVLLIKNFFQTKEVISFLILPLC